ncbi:thioredoxin family protein [bacterium]|nr:thioredoxin family protein [bacterium]
MQNLQTEIEQSPALMLYFTSPTCAVCYVLLPKLKELLVQNYPKMALTIVPAEKRPMETAQLTVFSFPTVLVFFHGKEFVRLGGSFSLRQLAAQIDRPYQMLFNAPEE